MSLQILKWVGSAVLIPSVAMATTVMRTTWEEKVAEADFVGIIQCTDAGGVVANFEVIETWKGHEKPGSIAAFQMQPDVWGPRFPFALCGERYLVTAFINTGEPLNSLFQFKHVPVWWRQIPHDYTLNVAISRNPPNATSGDPLFHQVVTTPIDFKTDILTMLALPAEEFEAQLLRAVAADHLAPTQTYINDEMHMMDSLKDLRDKILATQSLDAIHEILFEAINHATGLEQYRIVAVLKRGGLEFTTKKLKQEPEILNGLTSGDLESLISSLEMKSVPFALRPSYETVDLSVEKPKREDVPALKEVLKQNVLNMDFINAFEVLAAHEPEWLAGYSSTWENPRTDRWREDAGYWMGSYGIWRSGGDRKDFVIKLLEARDPYIRVAGAVYLCFEEPEAGKKYLKEFQHLEGAPGAWAALNLVRRGDKSAMNRALGILAASGPPENAGTLHQELQKRLVVLLSNTARASGLTLPDTSAMDAYPRQSLQNLPAQLLAWWISNEKHIVIHDPWLPFCEAQKVD